MAIVLAAATFGCGGGSVASAPATTAPSEADPTVSPRAGLVGAVDAARLAAVCENVRFASTSLDAGLAPQASAALDAALEVLRRPPADPALEVLATRWAAVRADAGDAPLARRMQTWCTAQHG